MQMVPDIKIVFKSNDGKRRELDYRKLPFSAWSELKAQLGFTPISLLDAGQSFDLEAFGAIIWLERKQHDRALRWPEVRRQLENDEYEFDLVDAIVDGRSVLGAEDEPQDEEAPDPTPAGN